MMIRQNKLKFAIQIQILTFLKIEIEWANELMMKQIEKSLLHITFSVGRNCFAQIRRIGNNLQ